MSPETLESFMSELCDLAAQETLPRFRSQIAVSDKGQAMFDPVTEADRAAELAIRNRIMKEFSDHGILGEEHGSHNASAEYQWIIDPVDGTRAFISGLPLWGTLIGLFKNGVPVAGVMDQPFTGERYISVDGASKFVRAGSRTRLKTSRTASLSDSIIMTTSPDLFDEQETGQFKRVEEACRLSRYGADCYAYCMLASGNIDLVIESGLQLYDIAALIPIIENAGGIVTDWQGTANPKGGQVLAAANKAVHAEALTLLTGRPA